MRILTLAAIASAATLVFTGCGGTWTREAYVPSNESFEFDGVAYEGVPAPGDWSAEDTWAEFEPQTREGSSNQVVYVSPYSSTISVRTSDSKFNRVIFERATIYIPDTQRQIELISETQTNQLQSERGLFLYASLGASEPLELDFEVEKSLYLVLEYSFRGASGENQEYRREVFKFNAELVRGDLVYRPYPTV